MKNVYIYFDEQKISLKEVLIDNHNLLDKSKLNGLCLNCCTMKWTINLTYDRNTHTVDSGLYMF